MKKIQMMLAMMLMAFVGFALQSCGSDDNDEPVDTYSWDVVISDRGTLSDEELELYNEMLEECRKPGAKYPITGSNTGTLSQAKKKIDESLNLYKSGFEEKLKEFKNEDKLTLSFILKDSKGAVVYTKYLKIDGLTVTIQ